MLVYILIKVSLFFNIEKYGIYVHQGYDQYVGLQAAITEF